MTFPFPAQGLGADSADHAYPSGNKPDNIVPFASLSRHNETSMPDAASALDDLLQEMLRMPNVNGAAIALDTGDYVECQASRGQCAPPAGIRCYPGVGLTGVCLSTGEVQVCNNTHDDSRADRQACQNLGVRSVLVVPIRRDSVVIGVLEALSSEAEAFDEQKLSCIRKLAEQVSSFATHSFSTLDGARHNHATGEPPTEQPGASSPLVEQTLPTDFDLQKVLHAVYVIQQYNRTVLLADCPEALHSEIDRQNVQGSKATEAPECGNPVDELCAALSPVFYDFGHEFPPENRYRSLAIAAILLAVLFGCYFFVHYARVSGTAQGPVGAGLATEADASRPSNGEPPPQPSERGAADMRRTENLGRMGTQLASLNSTAQYEWGRRDEDGNAIPQNYATAMAWFEEAAKKGDADAGWKLGLGYLKGVGVPKDETRAAEWFKKAANLGDFRAQTALSDLYFRGVGVPRDYVRAYTWASIAASASGNEDERVKAIGELMTTAQLENANRRTAAWFAQKNASDGQDLR